MNLSKPSSTITAATLAGLGMAALWALVDNFTSIDITAAVISSTTTFISALVGYFKKENVLPLNEE
jgi:hypothetical protein